MDALILLGLVVVVALDGASVGQFMISRPLVAGSLAGWIVGSPEGGLTIGLILELLQLPFFQIGGARVSEGGLGAVVGAAVLSSNAGPGGVALGVLLGLVMANVGGWTVEWLHRFQGVAAPRDHDGRLNPAEVTAFHWRSLARDAARGAVVGAFGLLLARLLGGPAAEGWLLDAPHTRLVLLAAGSFSLGAFFHNLGTGARSVGALLAGLAVGLFLTGVLG
ncbi:MAG: PTS sugar transporter subunit IIC [Gemmatimonadota bacterium]